MNIQLSLKEIKLINRCVSYALSSANLNSEMQEEIDSLLYTLREIQYQEEDKQS